MKVRILNIKKVWNRESKVENGSEWLVHHCREKHKSYLMDTGGNLVRDKNGNPIWFDGSDFECGFIEVIY